jgi:hypothetical protein
MHITTSKFLVFRAIQSRSDSLYNNGSELVMASMLSLSCKEATGSHYLLQEMRAMPLLPLGSWTDTPIVNNNGSFSFVL